MLSKRDISCFFAARWAARRRRTLSVTVSGADGRGMPGGGIRLCWGGRDAEDVAEEGGLVGFAFAWGVLEVNRVASATLRGL